MARPAQGKTKAMRDIRAGGAVPARAASALLPAGSDAAWALVFACWLLATASTLSALFFSEVMELPPCVLCWYQRIFMFPLVLLLPLGLFPLDGRVVRYTLPLASGGWLISVFQLLLVWGLVPEGLRPCTQGVPCSEVQIE